MVENPPKRCATCGCDTIRTIIFKHTVDEVSLDRECVKCQTTWTEIFKYVGLTNYTPGA